MSGIVGIWNWDGRPVDEEILAQLSAPLAHRGPDGEGRWLDGPVGLACQQLRVTPESLDETQPAVSRSGAVLVFDGRLDNRAELVAALRHLPDVIPSAPDTTLILAAYEEFGERFPERLNGDFALGLFDPRRQQMLLARDAIGVRPLYYYRGGSHFLFATEIKAILASADVRTKPNDGMLAEFILRGFALSAGDETLFEDILSFRPGHMALVTPGHCVIRRYWDFDPGKQIRLGSFPEYAHAFRALFQQAIRRRLRSAHPVAVSLSGGIDSSSIYCCAESMRRQDSALQAAVLGMSFVPVEGCEMDERPFLRAIERDYQVNIEQVPMVMGHLRDCREEIRHIELPFPDTNWNNTHHFYGNLHQRGSRLVLTGHWGDELLSDRAYMIDLFYRLSWSTVWAHLNGYGYWIPEAGPRYFRSKFARQVCVDQIRRLTPKPLLPLLRRLRARKATACDAPWYTPSFRSLAHARMCRQTFAMNGPFRGMHARSLYQTTRAGYNTVRLEWHNKVGAMHGMDLAFPFLDRDLVAFLLAIPGEEVSWKGMPKGILRLGLEGVLPREIAGRRWKADATNLANEATEWDYPELCRLLGPGSTAVQFGYVDGTTLQMELEHVKELIKGPGWLTTKNLLGLVGLELWLQEFFQHTRNRPGKEGAEHASSQRHTCGIRSSSQARLC